MMTKIIGLDVSLAATGLAIIINNGEGRWVSNTITIPTAPGFGVSRGDSQDLLRRMTYLADNIHAYTQGAHLIVIETGSYSTKTSMAHALAGTWWTVYRKITRTDVPILEVAPTRVKKYATGRGNSDKASVGVWAGRTWPDTDIKDNNQADALTLATIGAHHLGLNLPHTPTAYQTTIINAIKDTQ